MANFLLQEDYTYLLQENQEPLLLQSSLFHAINNFEDGATVGNGISITEKTGFWGAIN